MDTIKDEFPLSDLQLNHEIVETLLGSAATVCSWDFSSAYGDTLMEKRQALLASLTQTSNIICRKGGCGFFWVVVGPDMLNMVDGFSLAWAKEAEYRPMGTSKVEYIGILDRRWKVFCDQYAPPHQILIGVGYLPAKDYIPEHYGRLSVANFVV